MLYYIKDDNYNYGVYNDVNILKNNLKYLKSDKIKIFSISNNSFGSKLVKLDQVLQSKSQDKFLLYDKNNNEFIFCHNDKNFLNNMLKFFNCDNLIIIDVTINSMFINLDVKEEKVKVEKKVLSEEEKIKYYEVNRELNLLKEQKKRLEEKKTQFEADMELFNKFLEIKKKNSNFIIPELFSDKFEKMLIMKENNNLDFDNYLKIDEKYLKNSYSLLFEGGSQINLLKN